MADRMVTRELTAINESGKIQNGILNPNDLEENERILLDKYLNYKVRNYETMGAVVEGGLGLELTYTLYSDSNEGNLARDLSRYVA